MGLILYRSVRTPLEQVRDAVSGIAESRDFTRAIAVTSQGEVGATAGAVNRLVGVMRHTLGEFATAIEKLAGLSSQLAASVRQVEDRAMGQSETASAIAAAVEELTAGIREMADSARTMAEVASDSNTAAETGGQVMVTTFGQIRDIGGLIDDTAKALDSRTPSPGHRARSPRSSG